MPWCDAKGWGVDKESRGLTPCFVQTVFTLAPILFLLVVGPQHFFNLRSSSTSRRLLVDTSGKRLVDTLAPVKVGATAIMVVGPLLSIIIVLAAKAHDQYSGAFFMSSLLRSLSWLGSLYILMEELPSQEIAYSSWVLQSWWVLSLIANSCLLVTAQGFSAQDPAQLGGSILGTFEEFSNAFLVLTGFFVPKKFQHGATTPLPTLNFSSEWVSPSVDATRDTFTAQYPWWTTVSPWVECLCCWRKESPSPHHTSALSEQLLPQDPPPSSQASRQQASVGKIFEKFWRGRQPVVATTPAPVSMAYGSGLEGEAKSESWQQVDRSVVISPGPGSVWGQRKGSHDWSGVKKPRNTSTSTMYSAPVFTITIPRWVLVDEHGQQVVDVGPLLGEESRSGSQEAFRGGGPEEDDDLTCASQALLAVEEGEEILLPSTREEEATERWSPLFAPGLADGKRVAFEIVVRSEGGVESDWDRVDSSRLPSKWSVIRTYSDFHELYLGLCRRFGSEYSTALKEPALQSQDPKRGLHVADISADMRSLAAFLRTVVTLRLQCHELTAFLFPQDWRENARAEGERGSIGSMGGEERKWGEEEEVGEKRLSEGGISVSLERDKGDEVYLKQLTYRMRRALPSGEHHVRLRTIRGVVSGSEICRWLTDARECSSRQEAVELGTSLVLRGLLFPVVRGYAKASVEGEEEQEPLFVDGRLWLYRYSDRAGCRPFKEEKDVALFNTAVHVVIPKWSQTPMDPTTGGQADPHVVYEVLISTQGEAWTIQRRYRDFSQLDKRFKWLGCKMPTPLPAKRWVNHHVDETFLEERRAGLEAYLEEAIAAAQESPTVLGNPLMSFLDDQQCLKIGIPDRCCKEAGVMLDDRHDEETEEEKERESFDQLGKAVGGFA